MTKKTIYFCPGNPLALDVKPLFIGGEFPSENDFYAHAVKFTRDLLSEFDVMMCCYSYDRVFGVRAVMNASCDAVVIYHKWPMKCSYDVRDLKIKSSLGNNEKSPPVLFIGSSYERHSGTVIGTRQDRFSSKRTNLTKFTEESIPQFVFQWAKDDFPKTT